MYVTSSLSLYVWECSVTQTASLIQLHSKIWKDECETVKCCCGHIAMRREMGIQTGHGME